MNNSFWKNKRVLITGHNGFKGVWLTKWLDMVGARITGISLPPDSEEGIDALSFSQNYKNVNFDIRDNGLCRIIFDFQPEIIIHLAAQAIVKTAKEKPLETFQTNVMGTANLLESLRISGETVRSIVIITSDKVYENRETMTPYREDDPLMGSEPYSCSKVAEEQVAKAYFESYFREMGIGMATARASNTFGGGDFHFDRLIPYLEKCSFEGIVPQIRNPASIRPWQYVLDILNGYMMLAEHLWEKPDTHIETYNFGPDRQELYSVNEMADIICNGSCTRKAKQEFYEAGFLLLNSDKSKEELGWAPVYNVKEGLLETNAAYREYFVNGCSDRLYEERIQAYLYKSNNIIVPSVQTAGRERCETI